MERNEKVLVCGASFAGLTSAYWMKELGYEVTVVEMGSHLKQGGTPVDIKNETVEIIKRMGLFEKLKAHRIGPEKWEFKNAADVSEHTVLLGELPENEFEIERNVLLNMLFDLVKHTVSFIFNNTITALDEKDDGVNVRFKDGTEGRFQFVLGCDGVHSAVRKIWFGEESKYVHPVGPYFCIAIAERLLIEEGAYQLYAEPDKSLSMYAYNNKTDVIFIFKPQKKISYDFRNQDQIKEIVNTQIQGMAWRSSELKEELLNSNTFYFDQFWRLSAPPHWQMLLRDTILIFRRLSLHIIKNLYLSSKKYRPAPYSCLKSCFRQRRKRLTAETKTVLGFRSVQPIIQIGEKEEPDLLH